MSGNNGGGDFLQIEPLRDGSTSSEVRIFIQKRSPLFIVLASIFICCMTAAFSHSIFGPRFVYQFPQEIERKVSRSRFAHMPLDASDLISPDVFMIQPTKEQLMFEQIIWKGWLSAKSRNRYIRLGWDGSGFGNQMRAFVFCILYGALTDRAFLFDYPKFATYFNFPKPLVPDLVGFGDNGVTAVNSSAYSFRLDEHLNLRSKDLTSDITKTFLTNNASQESPSLAQVQVLNWKCRFGLEPDFFKYPKIVQKIRNLFNVTTSSRWNHMVLQLMLNSPTEVFISAAVNRTQRLGISYRTPLVIIQSRAWADVSIHNRRKDEGPALKCIENILNVTHHKWVTASENFLPLSNATRTVPTIFVTSESNKRIEQIEQIADKFGRVVYVKVPKNWHSSHTKTGVINTGLIDWFLLSAINWNLTICHGTTFCNSALARSNYPERLVTRCGLSQPVKVTQAHEILDII